MLLDIKWMCQSASNVALKSIAYCTEFLCFNPRNAIHIFQSYVQPHSFPEYRWYSDSFHRKEFIIWTFYRRHAWRHSRWGDWMVGRNTHGPLDRYVKLRVAHAPGMPVTFSPPPRVSVTDLHHGTCVTHVPRCTMGSLTRVFLQSRWRGKRSPHSRRMRNPQFYASGKRPVDGSSMLIRTKPNFLAVSFVSCFLRTA